MKKFIFLIYLVPFLLCVVAVWYFGHHRPEQKKNEVSPVVVKNTAPSITTRTPPLKQPPMQEVVNAPDKDSNPKQADRQVETNTPGTTDVAVGSSPNDSRTITPHGQTEGEHSHSLEETASEKVEYEALMKEIHLLQKKSAATLESAAKTLDENFPRLIGMLTLETPEEQREILMQIKDRIYNEMLTFEIGSTGSTVRDLVDDESEHLKYAWNSLLTNLIEHGYTLPAGVEKE